MRILIEIGLFAIVMMGAFAAFRFLIREAEKPREKKEE